MCHPAYPTTADLRRERDATVRDLADLTALRELSAIVANAIARVGRVDDLRHPDRRWSAGELVETLQGELLNIDGEVQRIRRSPLVLDDEG